MTRQFRIGAVALVTTVLLTSGASLVSAQAMFVEGAAFAAIERRNSVETRPAVLYAVPDQDMSGTVAGGAAAVGAWLTPSVSVRFEVGLPATLERSIDQRYPIPAIGLPYPGYVSSVQVWDRARTFSPLIGWHTGRRHGVQLGFVGGVAFVERTQRVVDQTVYPLFTPEVLASVPAVPPGGLSIIAPYSTDITTTRYSVGAQAGLDADIAIGSRLSVVPQVRIIGLDDGLSLRPGVGVRVRF